MINLIKSKNAYIHKLHLFLSFILKKFNLFSFKNLYFYIKILYLKIS